MTEPARVLVVDDNPDALCASARMVRSAGHQVLEASGGLEALEVCRRERPDLVLLDVVLPDLNGIEVCRRLRADPNLATTLVIHISAQRFEVDCRVEALEAGADAFLARPISRDELLAQVRALLRIRMVERALRESERMWRTVFGAAHDGILLLDSTRRVVVANERAQELFGYPLEDFRRLTLEQLASGEESLKLTQALVPASGPPAGLLTFLFRSRDGGEFPGEVSFRRLELDQAYSYAMVIRDLRERYALVAAAAQLEGERGAEIAREMSTLDEYTAAPAAAVTARIYSLAPLSERAPESFERFVPEYQEVLDRAVEQRGYKTHQVVSECLQQMAERLSALRAGPRDVVEVHATALRRFLEALAPQKRYVYVEESRIALVELMGYLLSQYRYHSLALRRTS